LLSTRLSWLCFVSPPLAWGRRLASIRHTSGDRAWLAWLTSGSSSHHLAPSCCRCRHEYVNRMNRDSMWSIWLVYLYCLMVENRPPIKENRTPHLSLFFSSCRYPGSSGSTFPRPVVYLSLGLRTDLELHELPPAVE
jgi:hypothetical protein